MLEERPREKDCQALCKESSNGSLTGNSLCRAGEGGYDAHSGSTRRLWYEALLEGSSAMRRRSFLAYTAGISAGALCPSAHAGVARHAIRVAAGQDRFNKPTPLGSTRSIYCKVSARDNGGGWSAFESQWRTKGGPPLHLHRGQDEWFYAIKGEYIFQVGEDRFRLTAGDSILLPRQVPHTFAFVEDGEGKMIFAFQPAGDMEAFFREQSKLTGTPSAKEVERMYRAHGLELVGPPLSL